MNISSSMGLEEYFTNTFDKKLLLYMPQREKEHLTAATQMLEKRRELEEVEKARKAEKEEFRMKMENLASRREEIEIRENQLKESLMKFETFIKENDAKLIRAKNKATMEREAVMYKEIELAKLKKERDDLQETLAKVKNRVKRLTVFYDYLRQVMAEGGGYEEPRAIIIRHRTLTSLLQHLRNKDRLRTAMCETLRQNLMLLRGELEDDMMTLHNHIANLQKQLDRAKAEAMQWDTQYFHFMSTATHKTLLMGMTRMAARNMYLMVMSRRTHRPAETDDFCRQMNEIRNYLCDLISIAADLQKEMRLAKLAHKS